MHMELMGQNRSLRQSLLTFILSILHVRLLKADCTQHASRRKLAERGFALL